MSATATPNVVAPRDTPVLIMGETGTGKALVAQGIHEISSRRKQACVVVNCAAIPEALLETELFGHARGAFTGAVQSRLGRIHVAHGGTLFRDEIGDLPLSMQAKLLRFLQSGEVQRLGSAEVYRVDVSPLSAHPSPRAAPISSTMPPGASRIRILCHFRHDADRIPTPGPPGSVWHGHCCLRRRLNNSKVSA